MYGHAHALLASIPLARLGADPRKGQAMILYCECEAPVIDVEHDAGCRRCGRPVDFSPRVVCPDCGGATREAVDDEQVALVCANDDCPRVFVQIVRRGAFELEHDRSAS